MQNVLIVGSGAVGSAYGWLCLRGGAKVTYLIKPKHKDQVEKGIQLYLHPKLKGQSAESIFFKEYEWIDNIEKIKNSDFDTVIITVASHSLSDGDWLKKLLKQLSQDTIILSLQPGAKDEFIIRNASESPDKLKLITGSIPIMSYWAPLPGEAFEKPGIAFWIPPLSRQKLDTKNHWTEAQNLAHFFNKAGLPTAVEQNFKQNQLGLETALCVLIAGLSKWDWSLDKLCQSQNLSLCADAIDEALDAQAKELKLDKPQGGLKHRIFAQAWVLKLLMRFLDKVTPFDLESFLRVHFTKVETQMSEGMQNLIETCKKQRVLSTSLSLVSGRLKKLSEHKGSPSTALIP